MKKIKLALDWTPNTNHTGFFVAKARGYYEEKRLDVEILSVDKDNYQTTPAKKVELGLADLALCPTESLLSYQTKSRPFDLTAIGSVFQRDLSAIVTLASNGLNRPAMLDGASYASYQARYEDAIVRQMIVNDGGKGVMKVLYPDKLGIWPILLNSEADATWIFLNWEGSLAASSGIELNIFKMSDYGIPYSYSPVIAGSRAAMENDPATFQAFLEASKKGFLLCEESPELAASILQPFVPEYDAHIDLVQSQRIANDYYGGHKWGVIEPEILEDFLLWLKDHDLVDASVLADDLILKLDRETIH